MSANADLVTMERYVQQGKTIEKQCLIYGLKCKIKIYIWLFEGPWGVFKYLIMPVLLSGYPLIHILYVHVK